MNQTIAQTTERPEDIFNLDFTPASDYHHAKAAPFPEHATRKSGKSPLDHIANLKTTHLVALVVIAMIGALAWIHLRHRVQPSASQAAQYVQTNTSVEEERHPSPPLVSNGSTAPPRATAGSNAGGATSADSGDAIAPTADRTDDHERVMVRRALEDLNTRLSALESQNAAQELKARLSSGVAAASTAHNKPRHANPMRSEALSPTNTTVLAGYSINTIFNDQAWIDHDGRSFVVQPGDHIGDVRILSIDARSRRVLTSNGAIK